MHDKEALFTLLTYDFAIIGAGAAGLNLLMHMLDDPFFADKQIILIDKESKTRNDRTWCFWEIGDGKYDDIIDQSWVSARFVTDNTSKTLDLSPYTYKKLKASDFYEHCKNRLSNYTNVHVCLNVEVKSVEEEKGVVNILTEQNSYKAQMVFDSRIERNVNTDKYTHLLQHFLGWVIETDTPAFDTKAFDMMDFRKNKPDSTSFTYILPESEKRALVEFTLFTSELIEKEEYEHFLKQYLEEVLHLEDYTIKEVESGIIPMADYPFHRASTDRVIKIGTAGSWVKPSSGYSFHNSITNSRKLVAKIKANQAPLSMSGNRLKRFFDSIFLDVLNRYNERGPELFEIMYLKNPPKRILKFLDEETNLLEDLRLISKFPKGIFTKSLFRALFR